MIRKTACEIGTGLLEAFCAEIKARHLPVHIQRGIRRTDENGDEVEIVEFEYPDYFDINSAIARAINKYQINILTL